MSSLSIFFKAIHPKDELWQVLLKLAKLLKMCISLPGIEGFICVVEAGDASNTYDVSTKSLLKYYVEKITITMKPGSQVHESQVNISGLIG